MIKLLACDVDGTLLPGGDTAVCSDTINILEKFISKNVNIAIASGRSYGDLKALFGNLSEEPYFICHDGALCIKHGKELYRKSVSLQSITDFASKYSGTYKCTAFYASKVCYVIGDASYAAKENTINIKNFREIKEPLYKLAVYDGKDVNIPQFTAMPFGLRVCSHSNGCIEYVPTFANKGIALRDVQSRLFLTEFDTAAIGNDTNDIKMFKSAKYSGAVLPCENNVMSAADITVQNANEFLYGLLKTL